MSEIVWTPSEALIRDARLTAFRRAVGLADAPYADLHRWSLDHPGEFWAAVWHFADVIGDPGAVAFAPGPHMTDAAWFPDARLNFAENLLRPADPDGQAILFRSESGDSSEMTRRELLAAALRFAAFLTRHGVGPGDRVVGLLPNVPEAVVAMLGTAAVGAVWACCSPDFGEDAVCDRFGPLAPAVFVSTGRATYAGKPIDVSAKADAVQARLPSVRARLDAPAFGDLPAADPGFVFPRFPFAHPLYVLFSSGTTGPPKGIVHGAGGTLLQHLKEHQLHTDVRPGDRLFFYTTTGWMMWNWLVSALASRAAVVLYDGSPFHPDADVLWRLADRDRVTQFGAGARYYAHLEQVGVRPRVGHDLGPLRTVLSTGSPLTPAGFDTIYRDIKPDVCVASISGGTDIVSCFALGCPTEPVRRGELQVKGLGMDVRVLGPDGTPVVGEPGELVCASPFPSMPVGFWNDPDKAKYRAAYFGAYPDVWCHGDWAEETPTGGLVIHGRSDATLNPGGVRIGSAEITRQAEAFLEVAEAMAVALRRDGDERVVLVLKLRPGAALDDTLVDAIKARLRAKCSPRHVPAFVVAAPDLPRTVSGKLSELAVRAAVNGDPVRNAAALANPESLAFFRGLSFPP
jgi:acetoacetyl-CoA synthetase